uniref:Uncharacterized protein n=1 Tax=Medicago truncatula TaxID=3880 RepID=I3S0C7_MEDTR|nr:unknown [Medicago truncatula]
MFGVKKKLKKFFICLTFHLRSQSLILDYSHMGTRMSY